MGKYMSSDSVYTYPVRFNDYWGRWTNLGVHGDATTATAEKGKVILEAAVSGLIAWLIWVFVHLWYLVGFQNRIFVFGRWFFNFTSHGRGARLITEQTPDPDRSG